MKPHALALALLTRMLTTACRARIDPDKQHKSAREFAPAESPVVSLDLSKPITNADVAAFNEGLDRPRVAMKAELCREMTKNDAPCRNRVMGDGPCWRHR